MFAELMCNEWIRTSLLQLNKHLLYISYEWGFYVVGKNTETNWVALPSKLTVRQKQTCDMIEI